MVEYAVCLRMILPLCLYTPLPAQTGRLSARLSVCLSGVAFIGLLRIKKESASFIILFFLLVGAFGALKYIYFD